MEEKEAIQVLIDNAEVDLLNEHNKELRKAVKVVKKMPDYKRGYFILAEYWDSISDEEKSKVDKLLKGCRL